MWRLGWKISGTQAAFTLGGRVLLGMFLLIVLCSGVLSFATTAWVTSEVPLTVQPWIGDRAVARLDYQPSLHSQESAEPNFSSDKNLDISQRGFNPNGKVIPADFNPLTRLKEVLPKEYRIEEQISFPVNLINPEDRLVLTDQMGWATNWQSFEPHNQWVKGHYPSGMQEIAVSSEIAANLSLQIGDTVTTQEACSGQWCLPNQSFTVVGIYLGSPKDFGQPVFNLLFSASYRDMLLALRHGKLSIPNGGYQLDNSSFQRRKIAPSLDKQPEAISYYYVYGPHKLLPPPVVEKLNQLKFRVLVASYEIPGSETDTAFKQQIFLFAPYYLGFFVILLLLLLPWMASLIRGQARTMGTLHQIGMAKSEITWLLGRSMFTIGAAANLVGVFCGYAVSQAFVTTNSGLGWKVFFFSGLIWLAGLGACLLAAVFPAISLLRQEQFADFRARPRKRSYRILAFSVLCLLVTTELVIPGLGLLIDKNWTLPVPIRLTWEVLSLVILVPSVLHLLDRIRLTGRGWLISRLVGANLGHYMYRSAPLVAAITLVTALLSQQVLISFDRGKQVSLPKQSVFASFSDAAGSSEYRYKELDQFQAQLEKHIGKVRTYDFLRGTPVVFDNAKGDNSQANEDRLNQVLGANGLSRDDEVGGYLDDKMTRSDSRSAESKDKKNWSVIGARDLLVFNQAPQQELHGKSLFHNLSVLGSKRGLLVDDGDLLDFYGFQKSEIAQAKAVLKAGGVVVNYPAFPDLGRGKTKSGYLQSLHLPVQLLDQDGFYYSPQADGQVSTTALNQQPLDSRGQLMQTLENPGAVSSEQAPTFGGSQKKTEEKKTSTPLLQLPGMDKRQVLTNEDLLYHTQQVQLRTQTQAKLYYLAQKRPLPEFAIISPQTAHKLGMSVMISGRIAVPQQVVLPGQLWSFQEANVANDNSHLQVVTQTLDRVHVYWLGVLQGFALLLVMAIVGMVVTLNSWEINQDLKVLRNLGASPRLGRGYSTWLGIYIGVAGVVPSLLVTCLGGLCYNWVRSAALGVQNSYWPWVTWVLTVGTGMVMIVAAAAAGWVFAPQARPRKAAIV